MLEAIDYIEKNDTAILCRCYGTGAYLVLPDTVAGLPVSEVADHCFAPEMSVRIPAHSLRRAVLSDGVWAEQEAKPAQPSALCGEMLKEIVLPAPLQKTGDYAFYGCGQLERIVFPASFRHLSGGAFVACRHIREIVFIQDCPEDTPPAMADIVSEISYDVTVTVQNASGTVHWRVLFPEYYEESTENTPARIIEIKYRGTGYQCRQCFRRGVFDFAAYDALFYLTSVWAEYSTVVALGLLRLSYPQQLSAQARQSYLAFLQAQPGECAEYVLREENLSFLQVLLKLDYFTQDILATFLSEATRKSLTGAVALLMDYNRMHFARSKYNSKYEW